MIVYCAADLLWASRIKGTADALGIACRPVRDLGMLRARLADSDIKGMIVDLEAGKVGLDLIRAVREQGQIPAAGGDSGTGADAEGDRQVRIVAFGPHVAVEELEAARQAGADRVYARGAFDRQLPEILRTLAGAGEESAG